MKHTKYKSTKTVFVGLSLAMAVASYATYLRTMTLADEYNYSFAGVFDGAVILLTLLASLSVFLIAVNRPNRAADSGIKCRAGTFACALLIAISGSVLIYANGKMLSFELNNAGRIELEKRLESANTISRIDLESLNGLEKRDYTGIVLIEREGCTFCEKEVPLLDSYLKQRRIEILSYDTAIDREQRKERVEEVMDQYGIEMVPTVIILDGGEVVCKFAGQNLTDQLDKYLTKYEM